MKQNMDKAIIFYYENKSDFNMIRACFEETASYGEEIILFNFDPILSLII